MHNFIDEAVVIELEQPIKYKTAEIRKKHNIKLPDAIIAATAIVNELTIVTRNTKDFIQIEGLKVINQYRAYRFANQRLKSICFYKILLGHAR